MTLNSYIGILLLFALVAVVVLWVGVKLAFLRGRPVGLGVQMAGKVTHIIPGPGHVKAADCVCNPRLGGLHGEFDGLRGALVEHRPLRDLS